MLSPDELRVPFALDKAGTLIRPVEAEPSNEFFCPECHGIVLLKRGALVQTHFAHKAEYGFCSFAHEGESEEHYFAKLEVSKLLTSGRKISFFRCCSKCGECFRQPFPSDVGSISLEYQLWNGRRVDVAFLREDRTVRGVLEICATHPVDADKTRDLSTFLWAEVSAGTVLETDDWPLIQDHFLPVVCKRCMCKRVLRTLGNAHSFVECPRNGVVQLIGKCSGCSFFCGIVLHGIECCFSRGG